jgi:hypothetical protein
MDKDAEIKQLTDERAYVLGWLDHPITKEIFQDLAEQQEEGLSMLCNRTPESIETFFGHYEAIGELRGIRRVKGLVEGKLADIEMQLKDLIE